MLHLLHQERRLRPPQQAPHVAHAGAEAHAADPHAAPEAVGALHELVRVLGALPASVFASVLAHTTCDNHRRKLWRADKLYRGGSCFTALKAVMKSSGGGYGLKGADSRRRAEAEEHVASKDVGPYARRIIRVHTSVLNGLLQGQQQS